MYPKSINKIHDWQCLQNTIIRYSFARLNRNARERIVLQRIYNVNINKYRKASIDAKFHDIKYNVMYHAH